MTNTSPSPEGIIAALPAARAEHARQLDAVFRRVTGWAPQVWGKKLIGYGKYHYRYDSGREGDFLATGFSALSSKFSLHILPGYSEFPEIADCPSSEFFGELRLYRKGGSGSISASV